MIEAIKPTDTYLDIDILFEDNHLLVVHKPRNRVVQSDKSHSESLQEELKSYLKEKYNKPGNVFLGLVHRLDRPVSGIMVFAKTSKAASRLSEQIRNHTFKKTYLALTEKDSQLDVNLIDYLYKDKKANMVKIVRSDKDGAMKAELSYTLLKKINQTSMLEIQLKTGRPHQIRVQLAHHGTTIMGDGKYGEKHKKSTQLELKSYSISFLHPTTKESLSFKGILADSPSWEKFLDR